MGETLHQFDEILGAAVDGANDELGIWDADAVPEAITKRIKVNELALAHDHDTLYEPVDANIQAHLLRTDNPHTVTKAQVGLGNCNNTADLDKPIPTSVQTALDGKEPAFPSKVGQALKLTQVKADETGIQYVEISGLTTPTGSGFRKVVGGVEQAAAANPTKDEVGLGNVTNDAQVPKSLLTTKGDTIAATGAAVPVRIPVGANGQVLTADSTQAAGVKWDAVTGVGDMLRATYDGGNKQVNVYDRANHEGTQANTTITGLGDASTKNVGTGVGTVAAGDHNHTGVYAPVASGVTNGNSHDHAGGDGAQISHTSLGDKGVKTHAEIDSHIDSTANPHSVTKTQVSLGNVTDDAQLKRAAGDINSFTEKGSPVSDDILLIEDSAGAAYDKKKIKLSSLAAATWSSLSAAIDPDAVADGTLTGKTQTVVAGTGGLNKFEVAYLSNAGADAGRYIRAKGDAAGTAEAFVMAAENIAEGASGTVLEWGTVRNDAWPAGPDPAADFTAHGAKIYLSATTGGAITTIAPTVGNQLVILGRVSSKDKVIHFFPAPVVIEIGDGLTDLASEVTGVAPIANGGTGQDTAQEAINALTNVAAATNEHVLTKDTATGHATWKVSAGGSETDPVVAAINGIVKSNGTTISAAVSDTDYASAAKGVTNGDSHDHIGGDGAAIAEGALSLSDVTTGNASTAKHGLMPKLVNTSYGYVRADGIVNSLPGGRNTNSSNPASVTPNFLTTDVLNITGLAQTLGINGITNSIGRSRFVFLINDDGTARTLNWNAVYKGGSLGLPATTLADVTKTIYLEFLDNYGTFLLVAKCEVY